MECLQGETVFSLHTASNKFLTAPQARI
jgi:hypothetical protein